VEAAVSRSEVGRLFHIFGTAIKPGFHSNAIACVACVA